MTHEPTLMFVDARPAERTEVVSIYSPLHAAGDAQPHRVALIGTFAPRKCGIATFTTDIFEQLKKWHPEIALDVYALDDPQAPLDYDGVAGTIAQPSLKDYRRAARRINASGADAVWLQHEYGIFGGPDGAYVRELVDRIAAPLVLTLHTVLIEPSAHQREILEHLLTRASRVMVMSEYARDVLIERYGADPEILQVIAHGAPDRPFGREGIFKAAMGVSGRKVLMTFGLLGPSKGLELAIEALPTIVARHPQVLYRIVGATHPTLMARDGESYREGLQALAQRLGVADHIAWDNRFLDTDELLDQLEACDVYITPYHNLQQSTSGTLSYAVALGKAVVSTPYVHARELLADGAGALIEPKSSAAIAAAVNGLLDDPAALTTMQRRAYARGRTTIWPRFAAASAELIAQAVAPEPRAAPLGATPGLSALFAMSDGTGMLQHGIGAVPDRRHGYCLDDNARALMVVNVVSGLAADERAKWQAVYASFVQHAWNEDAQKFRNFMAFDRRWCEDVGSQDSNGRALWALGQTVETASDPALQHWALGWFDKVRSAFDEMAYPRTVAFAMLGASAVLRTTPAHAGARELLARGGDLLARLLDGARRPDWAWFEAVLGYDNPRLAQALIEAGHLLDRPDWRDAGLESLAWIAQQQRSANGQFRPVGSESFGVSGAPLPFDQQPLEAQAAIEAARSAFVASGDRRWIDHANAAWQWYFGANDRGTVLADLATGRCRDGLTPRGANENCGAESILAFQLAHYSMLAMAADAADESTGDALEPGLRSAGFPVANP
ncbi:MAG TPA: glycosyltransferase family 4 protein [Novosphingobium sp.]|nr:glycosyltransferase family 4 protein [Novosphingobium sp.]